MKFFSEEIVSEVNRIGCEIKQFVTDENSYYCVNSTGKLYDFIKCKSIIPEIANPEDYHSYMLAYCTNGFYIFRQRFVEGFAQPWYVEAEIIPVSNTHDNFTKIISAIEENPAILEDICGEPHECDGPGYKKIF